MSIEKNGEFWNGTDFVVGSQSLLTTTADNFGNWSYDFTPPAGDADGQSYSVTLTASDAAFRSNNQSSSSISILKDVSGPSLPVSALSSPTAGTLFSGGDSTSINWNFSAITDSLSGLATQPVRLDYFDGSSFVLIADNLSNS